MEGQDYSVGNLTFMAGLSDGGQGCAQVTVTDDAFLEFDEAFSLSLSATSDPPGVTRAMASPESTDYTLLDDEGMSVSWYMLFIILYIHNITDGQIMCFTHTY